RSGLLPRGGLGPVLPGLPRGLPRLSEDVRRDRLEPGLLEAPGQPELVLVVVGDVGPHAEDVAALDLHPVVTGGLLELLERAIGELDVPELHALGRLPLIEAETVVPVGNIGASPQLEVHEPGLLATLTSYQLQTLAVAAGAGFSGRGVVYARGAGFCWPSEDSGAPWATSGATTGRGAGSGAFTGSSATVGVVGTCSSRSSAGRCRRRRGAGSRSSPSA